MRFLPPLLLHGAHRVDDRALKAHAQTYVDYLSRYPQWPELDELPSCPSCEVPKTERPAGPMAGREA